MKKLSSGIAIAIILSMLLAILPLMTVSAADLDLGTFTYSGAGTGNPTLQGWCTNGRDGIETNLDLDTLKAAKQLKITFSEPLPGPTVFIMQSEANWWDQKDGLTADGTTLVIDLTAMSSWNDFLASGTQANFFIGDWGTDYWANIKIVSAILSGDAAPAAAAAEATTAAPAAEYVPGNLTVGAGVSVIRAIDFDSGVYDVKDPTGGQYTIRPNETVATELGSSAFGGDVGWTDKINWIQYTINAEKAGKYDLYIQAAGGNGGTSDISCNDVLISTVTIPKTAGWQDYVNLKVGSVDLAAGKNVIKVTFNGGGFNLSALIFVEPTGTNPYAPLFINGTTTIKFVDFDKDGFLEETNAKATEGNWTWFFDATKKVGEAGDIYAYRTEYRDGNTGPQTEMATVPGLGEIGSSSYDGPGEYVSYTLNVLKAGKYALSMWAFSGSSDKTVEFYLDGNLAGTSPVIPNTGWASDTNPAAWALYDIAVVDLSVGTHVMKVLWPGGDINVAAYVFNEGETFAVAPAVEETTAAPADVVIDAGTPAPAANDTAAAATPAPAAPAARPAATVNNAQTGDPVLFPIMLIVLIGAAVVTVRRIKVK